MACLVSDFGCCMISTFCTKGGIPNATHAISCFVNQTVCVVFCEFLFCLNMCKKKKQ